MSKINYDPKLRSDIAEAKPRDSDGHFIKEPEKTPNPSDSLASSDSSFSSVLKRIITPSVSKTTDENTLIDVHVNNPLKKIVELLQDIKKQKVFSFSVKGSLGIAGIALLITSIGIFGGTEIFCSKGVQSHIGTIKALQTQEEVQESSIPILSQILSLLPGGPKDSWDGGTKRNRTILVKSDNTTIHLVPSRNFPILTFLAQPIIATGDYNSCSETLTLKDTSSIEIFK